MTSPLDRDRRVTPAMVRTTLLAICLLGLVLRLWGIRHGLPYVYPVDENFEVYRALRLGTGDFDFDRVGKGGLFYVLFVEYGFLYVYLLLAGKVAGAQDFARSIVVDPSAVWTLGRVTTAIAGAANVAVVYKIGTRVADRAAGCLAAFLFAVAALPVSQSRFINVDVPMTLMVSLTLLYAIDVLQRGRRSDYLRAGIFAGLAAMTKMPGALVVTAVVGAHLLRPSDEPWRARVSGTLKRLGPFGIVFALVYVAGTPGLVLKFGEIVERAVAQFTGQGWTADVLPSEMREARSGWSFYASALSGATGLAALVFGVAGAVLGAVRRNRGIVVLSGFATLFYVVLGMSRDPNLIYERYVLPIVPVIAVLAGFTVREVTLALRSAPLRAGVAILIGAVLGLPGLTSSVAEGIVLTRKDTRTEAKEWFDANVPAGSRVFMRGNAEELSQQPVPLDSTPENLLRMAERNEATDPGKAYFLRMRASVPRERTFDVVTAQMHETWPRWTDLKAGGVRYVVIRHRLDPDDRSPPGATIPRSRFEFDRDLNADPDVRLVATFDPATRNAPGPFLRVYEVVGD